MHRKNIENVQSGKFVGYALYRVNLVGWTLWGYVKYSYNLESIPPKNRYIDKDGQDEKLWEEIENAVSIGHLTG